MEKAQTRRANLTGIPADLFRWAKRLAADEERSLSSVFVGALQAYRQEEDRRDAERALRRAPGGGTS